MNCEEIRHYLDPLLDNELSVDESARILHHMEECLSCQSKWNSLSKLRTDVHQSISSIEIPHHLENNLRRAVDQDKKKEQKIEPKTIVTASVLALAAAMTGFIFITSTQIEGALVAQDIVKEESKYVQKAQPSILTAQENALTLKGWTLLAQQDCTLGKAAAIRFNFANENNPSVTLSVYQLKSGQFKPSGMTEHQIEGRKLCCGELGKTALIFCPGKIHDSVLVSSMPLTELMNLAIKNRIS